MEEKQYSSLDEKSNDNEVALPKENRPALSESFDNSDSAKTAKKRSQTSPAAWAFLITVLLGVGVLVVLMTGLVSAPIDSQGDLVINPSTKARILEISVILTAVSTTIAMFAILTMSANVSNIGESIEEIKESLRRK